MLQKPNLLLENRLCERFSLSKENYALALDEAGRGPIFGPVTIAAFVITVESLARLFQISQEIFITDSKKLSPKMRFEAYEKLKKENFFLIRHVAVWYIDRFNINQAIYRGLVSIVNQAVRKFGFPPTFLIMDGNYRFPVNYPFFSQIKGDQTSLTIAAASIAAKVERDILICQNANKYSVYGIAQNKGYPTKYHRQAVQIHGPSKYHRKSYLKGFFSNLVKY